MLSALLFILLLTTDPGVAADRSAMRKVATQDAPVVWVVGRVKRSGRYEFEEGMTVGTLVERAGGFIGTPSQLRIVRTEEGKNISLAVDLTTALKPNDTIVVVGD